MLGVGSQRGYGKSGPGRNRWDAARHEAAMARLEIDAMSGTRAQVEAKLARVRDVLVAAEDARLKADSERDAAQQALVAAEEARRKADEENGHLTDERLSLVMELEATMDDFAAFREKTSAEKTTMEEEFDVSSDAIFNYRYSCCAFAHNICGSEPLIPVGMPDTSTPLTPEFFVNPLCPLSSSSVFLAAEPIETFEEDLSAKDLLVAEGGVDILRGPWLDQIRNPMLLPRARAWNYHSLVERAFLARHFIFCFCTLTF